jgi:hypothetical protein
VGGGGGGVEGKALFIYFYWHDLTTDLPILSQALKAKVQGLFLVALEFLFFAPLGLRTR